MLSRLGHQLTHFKDKELSSTLTTTNRFMRFLDTMTNEKCEPTCNLSRKGRGNELDLRESRVSCNNYKPRTRAIDDGRAIDFPRAIGNAWKVPIVSFSARWK